MFKQVLLISCNQQSHSTKGLTDIGFTGNRMPGLLPN